MSTPARSRCVAVVCRMTCGLMPANVGLTRGSTDSHLGALRRICSSGAASSLSDTLTATGTGVALHDGMILSHSSVTRLTVGAALLAFSVVGCGKSSSPASTTSPTTPCTPTPTNPECVNPPNLLTVTIKGGVYSPNPVMVKVGQSVNWKNSDNIEHTATDPGVFDTGNIFPTS